MYPLGFVEPRAGSAPTRSARNADGAFTGAAIARARERSALLRDFADDEDVQQALLALPEDVVNVWTRYILSDAFEATREIVKSGGEVTSDVIRKLCRLLEVRPSGHHSTSQLMLTPMWVLLRLGTSSQGYLQAAPMLRSADLTASGHEHNGRTPKPATLTGGGKV